MSLQRVGQLPLTEDCHHYDEASQVPWDIQKYWHQRYSIFSAYDSDIYLTDDAWFGVTPEPVARKIASDLASSTPATKTVLVDLFAGAGGNTIPFALSGRWSRIIAIERDAATLACAQQNARAYGVEDDNITASEDNAAVITWVLGDAFAFLDRLQTAPQALAAELGLELGLDAQSTVLFGSPPWGGPGYRTHDVFDLSTMEPYSLAALHAACAPLPHALYLPRTSDIRQVARLAPAGRKIDVVQYCMYGASKAMVAYIPDSHQEEPQPQQTAGLST